MADTTNSCVRLPAGGMDLDATLGCGQSFSWERQGGRYAGVAGNRAVWAHQEGDSLVLAGPGDKPLEAADIDYWKRYFALDVDYAGLQRRFAGDPALAECVACAAGIRVLRQPFWDTLVAFILSQNNHLGRIGALAERLRRHYGSPLGGGLYSYPGPRVLAGLQEAALRALGAGYRAPYLIDAGQRVAGDQVDEKVLAALGDAEARRLLCTIKGVGPKVADCVLLFGLHRTAVAPMDVWMKRAVAARFDGTLPACAKGYEGIAQQYIFHWARQNPQNVRPAKAP